MHAQNPKFNPQCHKNKQRKNKLLLIHEKYKPIDPKKFNKCPSFNKKHEKNSNNGKYTGMISTKFRTITNLGGDK